MEWPLSGFQDDRRVEKITCKFRHTQRRGTEYGTEDGDSARVEASHRRIVTRRQQYN